MCLFCKISNHEIPSNTVLENDEFMAFHDINPKAPVHILVIPKTHVESFNDADSNMMAKMTTFIHRVVNEMNLKNSGYRVITNVGDDGAQEIKHLHFHLLGGAKLAWTHLSDTDPKVFL